MKLAVSLALCAAAGLVSFTEGYNIQNADTLNCRTEPSTSGQVVHSYTSSDDVSVVCQKEGESIQGNTIWDKTADGCYVADYYIHTGSDGYVAAKCDSGDAQQSSVDAAPSNTGSGKCGHNGGGGYTATTDAASSTPTDDISSDYSTSHHSSHHHSSHHHSSHHSSSHHSSSSDSSSDDSSSSDIPGPIEDDYPYADNCDGVDPWWYYKCECTSFAAWRINSRLGVKFHNHYKGPNWGNANTWDDAARETKVPINSKPVPGCIAQTNAGKKGHVAWVTKVTSTTVTIEEYNYVHHHKYSTRTLPKSTFNYIHIKV
ncbi:hypothetical protein GGI23_000006 [Coemansia sp. RSA 2559]|nr:hypothetical protein GGI23_000006 [Coemansia sp. RSA 2559]KAJ2869763.1 hypothetical protein GGI22_000005 [Coemansia erecta]